MKRFIIFIFFTVIISMYSPGSLVSCPQPEPKVIKNSDGTYTKTNLTTITLQACYGPSSTWEEEWTDYPENGGKFIRRMDDGSGNNNEVIYG